MSLLPAPERLTHRLALTAVSPAATNARSGRWPSLLSVLLLACAMLVLVSLWTLGAEDELSLGRKPWQNLKKTVAEMSEPSFLRVWFGDTHVEARDADGKVLRVDNQQLNERRLSILRESGTSSSHDPEFPQARRAEYDDILKRRHGWVRRDFACDKKYTIKKEMRYLKTFVN